MESKLTHVHDATDTITLLHGIEGLVDAIQVLAVRDELVDLELAVEIVVDEIGQLAAALDASECAALPDATGDELECYGFECGQLLYALCGFQRGVFKEERGMSRSGGKTHVW